MRIMIKGGVWKNTEDEILKAAVMKYGLNQWARISSLLVRKSAKQCKARWYEWLDPSIKKTEWSQEEDEKLLHLAKIMPCQWRTIAPIVGRTAAQCLERYEHLLDSVQHLDDNEEANQADLDEQLLSKSHHLSSSNIRRLRPGEIDPNPETKPARPDAIDMDEDEKEMLSEARARLANTKGKKAKRKAREKQLEQARRLASLQKRRELKAAGIHLKKRKKKRYKYLDYNNEIPFYRKTPRGFWDTTNDDLAAKGRTERARTEFKPTFITELEGERRDDVEERERKKDVQRQKLLKKINLPELVMRLNQHQNAGHIQQRKVLNLPQPQISETELEDIAKLSRADPESGGAVSGVSGQIRTPSVRHKLVEQASNALRMQNAATPLLGGHNVALYAEDWDGATPKRHSVQTPNINTPAVGAQYADNGASVASASSMSSVGSSVVLSESKRRKREKRKRKRLRSQFENLPAANYEYEVALPQIPRTPFKSDKLWVEDAADRDKRRLMEAERGNSEWLKRRSLAVQHKMPRPALINPNMESSFIDNNDKSAQLQAASMLIRDEMMDLIFLDNHNSGSKCEELKVRKEEFGDRELFAAKALLEKEVCHQNEIHNEGGNVAVDEVEMDGEQCLFVARLNGYRFVERTQFGAKLEAKKQEFTILYRQIERQKKKMEGMQSKLKVRMAGYGQIGGGLLRKEGVLRNKLIEMEGELLIYNELKEKEARIIPHRIEKWQKLIGVEKERQHSLQKEYGKIKDDYDALLQ